jgi:hypothetical protein
MMNFEISLETAEHYASAAADQFGLPQTLYRTADTCGWANTNPFASVLRGAEIHATILPRNYFA